MRALRKFSGEWACALIRPGIKRRSVPAIRVAEPGLVPPGCGCDQAAMRPPAMATFWADEHAFRAIGAEDVGVLYQDVHVQLSVEAVSRIARIPGS